MACPHPGAPESPMAVPGPPGRAGGSPRAPRSVSPIGEEDLRTVILTPLPRAAPGDPPGPPGQPGQPSGALRPPADHGDGPEAPPGSLRHRGGGRHGTRWPPRGEGRGPRGSPANAPALPALPGDQRRRWPPACLGQPGDRGERGATLTLLLTEGNLQSAAASLRAGTMLFPVPAALLTQFPIDNILAQFGRADSRIRLDLVGEDELR